MNNFQNSEVSGRIRLIRFLQYYHCTNLTPSLGMFNEVDYFARTPRGSNLVFEVKERVLEKYGVRYPDVILSVNKYNALWYNASVYNARAFFAVFDAIDRSTLYLFDVKQAPVVLKNNMLIQRTTCAEHTPTVRDVYHFSFDDAFVFCEPCINNWYYVRSPKYMNIKNYG